MLLIVTAIWAIATPVIKFTLSGFNSLTFLTYRFGLSSVIAIISILFVGWRLPKDKKILTLMLIYCLLNPTVILGFYFLGMEKTTVLDTTLIFLINPILFSTAGVIFLKEHITKREKVGMAIAALGTALTVIEPIIHNGANFTKLSGNILILVSAIISVGTAILAKKLLRYGVHPLTMTNFSFLVGFLTLLPLFLIMRPASFTNSFIDTPLPYHLGVIYVALLSGSLAYYLSNKAQKTIEVGESAVFAYLSPLFSAPLAVIWLKEKITPIFILGAVIITVGVIIAEVKKRQIKETLK
jgi:drug/metabolite transporter (DMT)-like permease